MKSSLVLIFLMSCVSVFSHAQQVAPGLTATSVEAAPVVAPTLLAGQYWTYRRLDMWRNEETETFSQYLLAELPDYWAVSWTILKSKDAQRLGSVTPEKLFTAGHGFGDSRIVGTHESLRFPLTTGKTWDFGYTFNGKPGSVTEIKQTATVKGWETVKVPAGTFRALRVEHQGYYATFENGSTWSGRIRETFWYAPSARRIVVHEYQDTGALGTIWEKRRDELVNMLL